MLLFLRIVLIASGAIFFGAITFPFWGGPLTDIAPSVFGGNSTTPMDQAFPARLDGIGVHYCQQDIYDNTKAISGNNTLIFPLYLNDHSRTQEILISSDAARDQFLVIRTEGLTSPCRIVIRKYAFFDKACAEFGTQELKNVGVTNRLPQDFMFGARPDMSSILLKDVGKRCLAILSDNAQSVGGNPG
jgi:hypothetical protein